MNRPTSKTTQAKKHAIKRLEEAVLMQESELKSRVEVFHNYNKITTSVTAADFLLVDPEEAAKRQIQLIGTPKNSLLEIFKRFFHSFIPLLSLIFILGLFITGLFVVLFSKNDPIKHLGHEFDIQMAFGANIPSALSPEMTRSFDIDANRNMFAALKKAKEMDPTFEYTLTHVPDTATFIAKYNAYSFLKALTGKEYFTLLGTNSAAQDVWTRTWFGTMQALVLGVLIAISESAIGIALGAYIGFHAGKWLDTFCMRIVEIFTTIPSLILFIILAAIFGTNFWALYIISICTGWVGPLYLTRRLIMLVKDKEYVLAAETVGASKKRLVFFHALPAILGKVFYSIVVRIPNVIFFVAALSFLGIIHPENSYNLGVIINNARSDFRFNPWVLILPVTILVSITLALKFVAIGFHDALEPKSFVKK